MIELGIDTLNQVQPVEPVNIDTFRQKFRERINRQIALSLYGCIHCGACADSCHYAIARPGDPEMTPAYKADQIRRIVHDDSTWIRRLFRALPGAKTMKPICDLNRLKEVVFGRCSMCRRCTFTCPMGVDNAALMRVARGILTEIGCVPEGVKNVCRNQSETGNQMRITPDEFSDTVRWVSGEVGSELGVPGYEIPVNREGCDFLYIINPREIKFDPRPLINAAKIFHVAGEKWTLSSHAWDHTNFGLFSGDDGLAACMAGRIYEAAEIVKAKRIVISECGHGYRCARWDGYNWTGRKQKVFVESVVEVILRYIEDGLIMVDRARNNRPVTFHDSCNTSRYGNLLEEPRRILKKVCMDFREMHPDRIKNFCCGAGGGLLVIPDYRDLRLDAAKFKAQQLKKAEADIVCTICYNCREGLGDLIEHYNLNMKVVQVMDLVNNALVLPEKFM